MHRKKRLPFHVGRGPVPRHRFAYPRPPPLCSSRVPDLELFVIRRSQTTELETHLVTMELAGDRPPRYDEKTVLEPSRGKPARMRVWHPRASALRVSRPSSFLVGRGPVPRRASIETGNGLGRRAVFARVERSRGTGPRATIKKTVLEPSRGLSSALRENRDPRSLLPQEFPVFPLTRERVLKKGIQIRLHFRQLVHINIHHVARFVVSHRDVVLQGLVKPKMRKRVFRR